jgi:hypothetical protein|tara:strand:- start:743 stop:895 length:153 start_codon:yes stop_codon:yes gene_type:complete
MRMPTAFDCDTARKLMISMEKHGDIHNPKYFAHQETVRVCSLREESEWKD